MSNDDILHQADVETVINKEIEQTVGKNNAAIPDLPPASAAYVQAEASATRTTLNVVLAALRANGIVLPT